MSIQRLIQSFTIFFFLLLNIHLVEANTKLTIKSKKVIKSKATTRSSQQDKKQANTLKKIRKYLLLSTKKMIKMKFAIDDSFCHIGAAYSGSYLASQNIDMQLFQPRPFHMLVWFKLNGKRFFIDQTMAQFFVKSTVAYTLLMTNGGFVGTKEDFLRFYSQYINDAKGWGDYENGGFVLPKNGLPSTEIITYEQRLYKVNWKQVNSRENRIKRVVDSWYGDFETDSSHDQESALFWTAQYYYNVFNSKVHVSIDAKPPI